MTGTKTIYFLSEACLSNVFASLQPSGTPLSSRTCGTRRAHKVPRSFLDPSQGDNGWSHVVWTPVAERIPCYCEENCGGVSDSRVNPCAGLRAVFILSRLFLVHMFLTSSLVRLWWCEGDCTTEDVLTEETKCTCTWWVMVLDHAAQLIHGSRSRVVPQAVSLGCEQESNLRSGRIQWSRYWTKVRVHVLDSEATSRKSFFFKLA